MLETKGEWEPTQRLEHLGLDVDLEAGLFRVPPHKLAALMRQARELLGLASREARLVPARLLAGFIGYAQSVYLACPSARFYLRALHDVLATRTSWGARVRLSRQALRDLGWWREIGSADVARAMQLREATLAQRASDADREAVLALREEANAILQSLYLRSSSSSSTRRRGPAAQRRRGDASRPTVLQHSLHTSAHTSVTCSNGSF